jgi:glutaredoxin
VAESRGIHHAVTVYGTDHCHDTSRTRALLDSLQVEYNYYNIDLDPAMARTAYALENGAQKIPVVKLGDGASGDVLVEPTDDVLEAALHRTGHLR